MTLAAVLRKDCRGHRPKVRETSWEVSPVDPWQADGDRGLASVRATEVEGLEGVCMLSAGGANNMAVR